MTLFLREGFPVYGVDRPNTGRSGTDICTINAVKLGRLPPSALPAINRYAAESSWVTFRWGPKFGEPYPNTQFPIAFADNYYPQTVSTYRDPEETQKSVAAYAALIDKIGEPVIFQSWSSSGLLGYLTAIERPDKVKAILAVETSVTAFDMIRALEPFCETFLYTNIDTEGLMGGIPMETVLAIRKATSRRLIVAGGITTQEEIDNLEALGMDAVVGMALYSSKLSA